MLLGAGIDVEVCHVREKGVSEVKIKAGKPKNKILNAASAKHKAEQRRSHSKDDQAASNRQFSDSKLDTKRNSFPPPIVVDDSDGDEPSTTRNHSFLKRTRTVSDPPIFSAKRERLL